MNDPINWVDPDGLKNTSKDFYWSNRPDLAYDVFYGRSSHPHYRSTEEWQKDLGESEIKFLATACKFWTAVGSWAVRIYLYRTPVPLYMDNSSPAEAAQTQSAGQYPKQQADREQ